MFLCRSLSAILYVFCLGGLLSSGSDFFLTLAEVPPEVSILEGFLTLSTNSAAEKQVLLRRMNKPALFAVSSV